MTFAMARPLVMVVDDEAPVGRLVARVAEAAGFATSVLQRAEDFPERFRAERPDVVVLDMIMPGMDGIEIIRWLLHEHAAVPVISLSGSSPLYGEMGCKLGAAGQMRVQHLQKPFEPDQLRRMLATACAGHGGGRGDGLRSVHECPGCR